MCKIAGILSGAAVSTCSRSWQISWSSLWSIFAGQHLKLALEATVTARVEEKRPDKSGRGILFSVNIVLLTECHGTWLSVADNVFFFPKTNTFINVMQVMRQKAFGIHAGAELMASLPAASYVLCVRSLHSVIQLAGQSYLVSCGVKKNTAQ